MRRIIGIHGLIAGAVMSAMLVLMLPFRDTIGFDKGAIVGYTSMVLAFLMVYFGVRAYRDEVAGGRIGFWRALGVGVAIVAVASVVYVVTWELVYRLALPNFMDEYAAYAIDQARRAGAGAAQLDALTKEMDGYREMYARMPVRLALTLAEPLPVGLLFAVGSAAWLSRRPRQPAGAGH